MTVTHDSDENGGKVLQGQLVYAADSYRKWSFSSPDHEDIGFNFRKRREEY